MMLIEKAIETKLKNALADKLTGCEVIGSWQPSDAGSVKGQHDNSAKAVVSVYVAPRQHDSFSLPTVNMSGAVSIDASAEMCPTMAEVSEIYDVVSTMFDGWHYDAQGFSQAMSIDGAFFAAEIRLDGGASVAYDKSQDIWTVSLNFTIRGTVIH